MTIRTFLSTILIATLLLGCGGGDSEFLDGRAAEIYGGECADCLLYTSPSPRDLSTSRMPSSA